jgi:cellulose synthase/poly-beta-1,6-N-acetylglucosamine synthase-like glycosyltransferase
MLEIYFVICLLLSGFYAFIMLSYWYHWRSTPEVKDITLKDFPKVSILIPVRDEAANILHLISDLLKQDYPADKLEVIVIDDHSADNTAELVQSVDDDRIHLIRLGEEMSKEEAMQAYKKKAIETGAARASGEWILTTDGDCRINHQWVKSMLAVREQQNACLVTGPVMLEGNGNLFEYFQVLDFMGMMGITAASLRMGIYNMANGANMLYEKKAFMEVGGFRGINNKASGDDMLLVYKMAHWSGGRVAFAKSKTAIVITGVMPTLGEFLQQRFRWTSKSGDYQDKRITWILGLVYLSVLTMLVNLTAVFFEQHEMRSIGIQQLMLKLLVEIPLLYSTSRWFGKSRLMLSYVSSQFFHILYIVFVGTFGNILKYRWKGRVLR